MNEPDSGVPDLSAAQEEEQQATAATPAAAPRAEESADAAQATSAAPNDRRQAQQPDHAPADVGDMDDDDDDVDEDEDADDERDSAARAAARAAPPLAPIRFEDVVSGQFDAEEANTESVLDKRVLAPQADTPKLHKVLAQTGLGSRLEMEQLIVQGRISVNNEPAHIGQRIQFGDQIKINGKPIRFRIAPPPPRVIAYHKPVGEVVTHDDPQNRPTVFRKLPRLHQGKWQSVGRLDLNTEGLLLFTSSGELGNRLMHPRFGLEREYAVRVLGALTPQEKQRLLDGIELEDGRAQFGSVEEGGGEGANTWYRVTISEGRNREVRRLFEAMGHAVSRLIRIRYGAMVLPRGLKRGAWMELDERDIQALAQAAGSERPRQGEGAGGGEEAPGRNKRRGNRTGGPRGAGGEGQRNPGQHNPGQRAAKPGNRGGRANNRGPVPGAAPAQGPFQGQGQGQGQQRRRNRGEGEDRQSGAGAQPDPMKTAFGYIGADSFTRQRQAPGGGQRRGGGGGGPARGPGRGGGGGSGGGGFGGGGGPGGQRRGGRGR